MKLMHWSRVSILGWSFRSSINITWFDWFDAIFNQLGQNNLIDKIFRETLEFSGKFTIIMEIFFSRRFLIDKSELSFIFFDSNIGSAFRLPTSWICLRLASTSGGTDNEAQLIHFD